MRNIFCKAALVKIAIYCKKINKILWPFMLFRIKQLLDFEFPSWPSKHSPAQPQSFPTFLTCVCILMVERKYECVWNQEGEGVFFWEREREKELENEMRILAEEETEKKKKKLEVVSNLWSFCNVSSCAIQEQTVCDILFLWCSQSHLAFQAPIIQALPMWGKKKEKKSLLCQTWPVKSEQRKWKYF